MPSARLLVRIPRLGLRRRDCEHARSIGHRALWADGTSPYGITRPRSSASRGMPCPTNVRISGFQRLLTGRPSNRSGSIPVGPVGFAYADIRSGRWTLQVSSAWFSTTSQRRSGTRYYVLERGSRSKQRHKPAPDLNLPVAAIRGKVVRGSAHGVGCGILLPRPWFIAPMDQRDPVFQQQPCEVPQPLILDQSEVAASGP